ncbi:MAG TPA: DUF6114 domain-containing protein [Lentibacillus sp.]|uniref:DUF6114 domain-containing protein n=1 Tax=Lentibacillus sp. TaxID=1925746 RepID=UPI002B4AF40C|nr:DUF6114 domain-containing protein [Lentibacillus sp.]HLR62036.1 DUF6114 domain-containing protein [Lentibacillus sp.]
MDRKEARALKKEKKLQARYTKIAEGGKFKKWRNRRPFWGATLSLLAGLLVLYIPLQLYAIAFIPGSLVFVGFIFGGLILITGIFSYIYPQFSTVFGVVVVFLSVLSVMGALGGFIIGTIFGIIGGSLLIAWEKTSVEVDQNGGHERQSKKEVAKQPPEEESPEVVKV